MEELTNYSIYKRTADNILKPLRRKWKLKNYSLVIERLAYEYLQLKAEKQNNPFPFVQADIQKLIKEKI